MALPPIQHQQSVKSGVFYIEAGGVQLAELSYIRLSESIISINHTFVSYSLRGQGIARQLLDAAVDWARKNGLKVGATCSYVVAQFEQDPVFEDVRL
jgi:predicted GNAT family acetyltransferase